MVEMSFRAQIKKLGGSKAFLLRLKCEVMSDPAVFFINDRYRS